MNTGGGAISIVLLTSGKFSVSPPLSCLARRVGPTRHDNEAPVAVVVVVVVGAVVLVAGVVVSGAVVGFTGTVADAGLGAVVAGVADEVVPSSGVELGVLAVVVVDAAVVVEGFDDEAVDAPEVGAAGVVAEEVVFGVVEVAGALVGVAAVGMVVVVVVAVVGVVLVAGVVVVDALVGVCWAVELAPVSPVAATTQRELTSWHLSVHFDRERSQACWQRWMPMQFFVHWAPKSPLQPPKQAVSFACGEEPSPHGGPHAPCDKPGILVTVSRVRREWLVSFVRNGKRRKGREGGPRSISRLAKPS